MIRVAVQAVRNNADLPQVVVGRSLLLELALEAGRRGLPVGA